MTFAKNIVTDYACPTNGTSDVRASFLAWKADAQGQTAILTVPPGNYKWAVNTGSTPDSFPFEGIPNLTVVMNGATFLQAENVSWGIQSAIQVASPQQQARIQTATAGQSSVKCITTADSSIFPVGRWVSTASYDLQGGGSDPPNAHYCEFAQITAVNSSTGVVTFSEPLQHTHLSTFPNYDPGSNLQPDEGGPATIYLLPAAWDAYIEFQGGTADIGNDAQSFAKCREVKWRNFKVMGTGSIIPTANKIWTLSGPDASFPFVAEFDKMIEKVVIEDGASFNQPFISSSAPNLMIIDGASVTTLNGTPLRTVIRPGSTIGALRLGPLFYGRCDSVDAQDCTISEIVYTPPNSPTGDYSISGGVISKTKVSGPFQWGMPDTNLMFVGQYDNETGCKVISNSESGSNTNVATTLSGGFPNVPPTSGVVKVGSHPCPRIRFSNVTGCNTALDLSKPSAWDKPYGSYSERNHTQALFTTPAEAAEMWGWLVSLRINVTTAYAGATTPATLKFSQFDNYPVLLADGTKVDKGGTINLRQAGERIITPNGVTFNGSPGSGSGDANLTDLVGAYWFTGPWAPFVGTNISDGTMAVTIEIKTDQGIITDRAFACRFA